MPQTAVTTAPLAGVPGQIADLYTALNGGIDSHTSGEASAEIPFGVMVIRGATDNACLNLHTSAAAMEQLLLGITVRSNEFSVGLEIGPLGGLLPGCTFGVGKVGRFWVRVEDAVDPGDPVRVRAVVAGAEVKGAFRTAADSTDCIDISAFAKWLTSAGAGEMAEVWINMVNGALANAD